MWNFLIGFLFIIGGLSGEYVLSGTNSSALLVLVGIVLMIVGSFKLMKDYGDDEYSNSNISISFGEYTNGKKVLLSSLNNPQCMVGSIVYNYSTRNYIGELVSVSKEDGKCIITNSKGKKRKMKLKKVMVMVYEEKCPAA